MSYSAAIDRMMASVRPRLPGALDPAIQDELFMVVDEFLKDTQVWREMQSATTVVNQQQYTITPNETYALVDKLMGVWDITQALPPGITASDSNWEVTAALDGSRVSATMPVPGTLLLKYPPSQIGTLAVVVSLTVNAPKTNDGYPQVPTWICDRFAQKDWLDGLLGKMMSQSAKPYTNQQMAVYHLRRFRTGITRARAAANHGNVYGVNSWSYPRQFAVRHRR